MLAELFARRDNASDYDGNPMNEFSASIEHEEYGPDEMPRTIGLYSGPYTIIFSPGKCVWPGRVHFSH
jgi:hypothetical protein